MEIIQMSRPSSNDLKIYLPLILPSCCYHWYHHYIFLLLLQWTLKLLSMVYEFKLFPELNVERLDCFLLRCSYIKQNPHIFKCTVQWDLVYLQCFPSKMLSSFITFPTSRRKSYALRELFYTLTPIQKKALSYILH